MKRNHPSDRRQGGCILALVYCLLFAAAFPLAILDMQREALACLIVSSIIGIALITKE